MISKKLTSKKNTSKKNTSKKNTSKNKLIHKDVSHKIYLSILKIVKFILDSAHNSILNVFSTFSVFPILSFNPYFFYFNDKLNIHKFNLLIAFFKITKNNFKYIFYNVPEYKSLKSTQQAKIRNSIMDGTLHNYPLYYKIYKDKENKLQKLISLYPFLQYIDQLNKPTNSPFFDIKRFLFSDCVTINYVILSQDVTKLYVEYCDSIDLTKQYLLSHIVYTGLGSKTITVNKNIPKIQLLKKANSLKKFNSAYINDSKLIVKIDNDTLQPISGYIPTIDDLIDKIYQDPNLEIEIMSGKYSIFNY